MVKLLAIKFFDEELSLLRWLILNRFTTGKTVLPTILKIRQARERVIAQ